MRFEWTIELAGVKIAWELSHIPRDLRRDLNELRIDAKCAVTCIWMVSEYVGMDVKRPCLRSWRKLCDIWMQSSWILVHIELRSILNGFFCCVLSESSGFCITTEPNPKDISNISERTPYGGRRIPDLDLDGSWMVWTRSEQILQEFWIEFAWGLNEVKLNSRLELNCEQFWMAYIYIYIYEVRSKPRLRNFEGRCCHFGIAKKFSFWSASKTPLPGR